jgi:hypothetical protein
VYYLETFRLIKSNLSRKNILGVLFRVRFSLVPSAFQCIFYYLEDPGLIRDKYGENKTMKKFFKLFFFSFVRFMDIDDSSWEKKF